VPPAQRHVAQPARKADKKDPAVARRVGKFWERMPERQVLYALHPGIVQLRNGLNRLYYLQLTVQSNDFASFYTCFNRNKTHPFRCQWIAGLGFESGWCAAQA
jgi:hypothetical protein